MRQDTCSPQSHSRGTLTLASTTLAGDLQTVQGGWLQFREGDSFFLQQLEDFSYKKTPAQMSSAGISIKTSRKPTSPVSPADGHPDAHLLARGCRTNPATEARKDPLLKPLRRASLLPRPAARPPGVPAAGVLTAPHKVDSGTCSAGRPPPYCPGSCILSTWETL